MEDISDLFRTIVGWQPSPKGLVTKSSLPRPQHLGHGPQLEVIIKQLNNGLLFASIQTVEGHKEARLASYDVENVPTLPENYKLINLTNNMVNGRPAVSATFQYNSGKTPDGNTVAQIEYTIRHYITGDSASLFKLITLYASQEVEGGRIDVMLNEGDANPNNPFLKMKAIASDKLYAELSFDEEGNLPKLSRGVFIGQGHPFFRLYHGVTSDLRVDTLRTAVSLVNGFPAQRPLHMEQLIVCLPSVYQPRLL